MATSYGAVPAVGEQLQKSGWLEQIDHGVYKRPNDSIQWQGALYAVQTLQGLPVCKSKTLVSLYG
ncbi:MAG TPA: AbiEi antitoxin N-terminal domain-containing protein, partial [Balneolaceae bacterium]|nr:AbiEi antitoxin N-terminal domain-containing protein [Balneolaceae bacterium]